MGKRLEEETGFPWNGNVFVEKAYSGDNYRIVSTKANNKKAIIFFSGNGLYFPNTEEVFCDVVVKNDRYEFQNIGTDKVVLKAYEKIIFVRDIYKQWYINGINEKCNSIDKTIDFLRNLLVGYEVVTCGVSAGGYMATIVGIGISAKSIVNISGQWKLNPDAIVYRKYVETNKYEMINLCSVCENKDRIFYFYPAKSKQDIEQYEYVKNALEHVFAIDTDIHGVLLRVETFPHLFASDRAKIIKVCELYKNDIINAESLFDKIVPIGYRIFYRLRHLMQMIYERCKR